MIIETVKPGDTEIRTQLTNAEADMSQLLKAGLNIKELLANSVSEFLDAEGTQYRVIMLAPGTFISGALDLSVEGMKGGDVWDV